LREQAITLLSIIVSLLLTTHGYYYCYHNTWLLPEQPVPTTSMHPPRAGFVHALLEKENTKNSSSADKRGIEIILHDHYYRKTRPNRGLRSP